MRKGYKCPEGTRKEISLSMINFSKEHPENLQKLSRFRVGKTYEEIYGEEKAKEIKEKQSKKHKSINFNSRFKIGQTSGNKSNNWKGGITPLNEALRHGSMFKIWRNLVFLRDNFTCQNPNCHYCHNKVGVMLHPHHIKSFSEYPELRFNVNNGITYCKEFHLNSKLLHKNILKGAN